MLKVVQFLQLHPEAKPNLLPIDGILSKLGEKFWLLSAPAFCAPRCEHGHAQQCSTRHRNRVEEGPLSVRANSYSSAGHQKQICATHPQPMPVPLLSCFQSLHTVLEDPFEASGSYSKTRTFLTECVRRLSNVPS